MSTDIESAIAVKDRFSSELLGRSGVVGLDVGLKYVGGNRTNIVAIRVFVSRKSNDIPEQDRIPKLIDGIPSDVIERGALFALGADLSKYDPLQGGCNGGTGTLSMKAVVATLGSVVRDRESGNAVALTTFHGQSGIVRVCQPASVLPCDSTGSNALGGLLRTAGPDSTLDAAICDLGNRKSRNWIIDIGPTALPIAATLGMQVRKRGMSTQVTYGTVVGIHGTQLIDYRAMGHGLISVTNLITFARDKTLNSAVVMPGDSGSLLVTGGWIEKVKVGGRDIVVGVAGCNPIGLVIAGELVNEPTFAVATPIETVLSALNIELYFWGDPRLPPTREFSEAAELLGGVAQDGGGYVVTPSGIYKVPPSGDPVLVTSLEEQLQVGLAIGKMSVMDEATKESVQLVLAENAVKRGRRRIVLWTCGAIAVALLLRLAI